MNKLFFIVICMLISSCSTLVSLYPRYSSQIPRDEDQWVNVDTGKRVDFDLYTACYHEGIETLRKNNEALFNKGDSKHEDYKIALYHGKCLYEKGYRFSTSIFSIYCLHYSHENECEAYKKYRK